MKVSKEIKDLFDKHDLQQIADGIKVEREHNVGPTDVVDSNLDLLKIVLAHLEEASDYYTKLQAVEEDIVSSDNPVVGLTEMPNDHGQAAQGIPLPNPVDVDHGDDLNEGASPAEIKKEYRALAKLPKASLDAEYKRSHRVSSPKGEPKDVLISDILRAKYGDKAVAKAFGLSESKSYILEEGTGLLTEVQLLTEAPHFEVGNQIIDFQFEEWEERSSIKRMFQTLMGKTITDKHGNEFTMKSDKDACELLKKFRKNAQVKRLIK